MQLTVWHKGTDKPVRDGVYERDYYGEDTYYCRYMLKVWFCGEKDKNIAAKSKFPSVSQNLPWRGITKDEK